MEVSQENQDCELMDKTYSEGSEICTLMRCIICSNGKWGDRQSYGIAALTWQPFFRGLRPI
jgi:hypothetical protein